MWITSTLGHFSIVKHKDLDDHYLVRTRSADDLILLRNRVPRIAHVEIDEESGTDYQARIIVTHQELAIIMLTLGNSVTYPNAKSAMAKTHPGREDAYMHSYLCLEDIGLYDKFHRMLRDNETWIGVFENRDLGHPHIGRRVALAFDESQWDHAIPGKTTSPDHVDIGLGWRYVLVSKCETAHSAVSALKGDYWADEDSEDEYQVSIEDLMQNEELDDQVD